MSFTENSAADGHPERVEQIDTEQPDGQAEQPDAEQGDEQPEQDDERPDDPVLGKALKDAAKYRTRLRETETERDELAATVDAYRRADAERAAAKHLADPADLWRDGLTPADLLGEDGKTDPALAAKAAADVAAAHPHWKPACKPYAGPLHSGLGPAPAAAKSWQAALKDA